jgi:hypothetical protein
VVERDVFCFVLVLGAYMPLPFDKNYRIRATPAEAAIGMEGNSRPFCRL